MTKESRVYNEEKMYSSISGIGENCIVICNRIKLDHYLMSHIKIGSKQI